MSDLQRFREAMAKHLGAVLSPEVAAQIEAEAFFQPDQSIDLAQFAPVEYEGLVFAAERFRAIRDELEPLHQAHFAETERARAGQTLKPNFPYIEAAERRGDLLQFTARKDGALVGNIRMYLYDDLHTSSREAAEDTLYLAPAARHGFTASRFVEYAERCLAQAGVNGASADTKILHDEHGNVIRDVGVLLRRRGWKHVANKFYKRISKE